MHRTAHRLRARPSTRALINLFADGNATTRIGRSRNELLPVTRPAAKAAVDFEVLSDFIVQLIILAIDSILENRQVCRCGHSIDAISRPHTAAAPFGADALPETGALSNTIKHYFTTLNSLLSKDCVTLPIRFVERLLPKRATSMQETDGHIKAVESSGAFGAPRMPTRPITSSMTAKAKPHEPSEFKSVLLAIAGHDLRQPLQVIQNAHEFLGRGVRTTSELRMLRFAQTAIDRLRDQLDELVAALQVHGHVKRVKLTPVPVGPLLQQVTHENAVAALTKGVSVRTVPTSATIDSDALLLGTVLRNLVSNAVKYTQPGGRILLGCRHAGQSIRIDVYDTGIGIAGDQMPRMFEAFTRLDPARRDSLGIGLFIVRQAIGILGHGIDVASTPSRGSRFSIFASRVR